MNKLYFQNKEFQFFSLFFVLILGMIIGSGIEMRGEFADERRILDARVVISNDEKKAREDLLKIFLDEQAYLQSRVVELRKKFEEGQEKITAQAEIADIKILDKLKERIGLTEIKGRGVEITLDDSYLALSKQGLIDPETVIQSSDLRDLVNVLFAKKATAVAINGQRIVAGTAINSVGNAILVNNSYITPPFSVQAVGDTELMLQGILDRGLLDSLYQKRSKKGVLLEIKINNFLNIPIYNGDFKTTLLTLIND